MLLGVSPDTVQTHARWSAKEKLPYSLLADPDGTMARAYGVERKVGPLKMVRRATFVVDAGGCICKVYGDVSPFGHAEQVLAFLERDA